MRTLVWTTGGLLFIAGCIGIALSMPGVKRDAQTTTAALQRSAATAETAGFEIDVPRLEIPAPATLETVSSEAIEVKPSAPLPLTYEAVVQPVAIDAPHNALPNETVDNTEAAAAEPVVSEPMVCQPDALEMVVAAPVQDAVDHSTQPGRLQATWGERQSPAWSLRPLAESRVASIDTATGDLQVRDVLDSPTPGQKPALRPGSSAANSPSIASARPASQDAPAVVKSPVGSPVASTAQTTPPAPLGAKASDVAPALKPFEPKKLPAAPAQRVPELKDLFATRSVAKPAPAVPSPAPAQRTLAGKARPLTRVAHDEPAPADSVVASAASPEPAAAVSAAPPAVPETPAQKTLPASAGDQPKAAVANDAPKSPTDEPKLVKRTARRHPPVAAPRAQPEVAAQPAEPPVAAQPRRSPAVINAMAPYIEQRTSPAISETELFDLQRHAMAHVRRGFQLGGRMALFAARAEFVQSLIVIAQALDAQHLTTAHSRALAEGLATLNESDDFLPSRQASPAIIDLAGIVARHNSTVLRDADLAQTPTLIARQRYFEFAQERLAYAVEMQPAGAMALHGLAKLGSLADSQNPDGLVRTNGKAMALEQAALAVDPSNFMAANDLAVLLYQQGRMAEARALLRGCVGMSTEPMLWHNLAAVHDALGESRQAQLARVEAVKAQRNTKSRQNQLGMPLSPQPEVQWVEPSAFASAGQSNTDGPSAPVAPATGKPPVEAARRPTSKGMWK